jgi:hypothetical protein
METYMITPDPALPMRTIKVYAAEIIPTFFELKA